MPYNIFLDDDRFPSEFDVREYYIVRTYEDFINLVLNLGVPDFISFDHDLGPGKDGYDCAKFLVNYMLDNKINQKINFQTHSQNPPGEKNIRGLLENWNREFPKNNLEAMLSFSTEKTRE